MEKTMEKIVALAKNRGFVYPGSEIYGGLANTWDYGNLGVELTAAAAAHPGRKAPFPLVKDIVGYLKMCHSILPIKR